MTPSSRSTNVQLHGPSLCGARSGCRRSTGSPSGCCRARPARRAPGRGPRLRDRRGPVVADRRRRRRRRTPGRLGRGDAGGTGHRVVVALRRSHAVLLPRQPPRIRRRRAVHPAVHLDLVAAPVGRTGPGATRNCGRSVPSRGSSSCWCRPTTCRDSGSTATPRLRRDSADGSGDVGRAAGLFDLAASRSRPLLEEVAKVEHGLARHVLKLRGLVLRYVKALLALLTTAVAVYAADAVVADLPTGEGMTPAARSGSPASSWSGRRWSCWRSPPRSGGSSI